MLTLQPQASFTVVRQIADHTDTSTYYVQAVVRDAYTDDILDTIQLEDRGGQRFKKNWQVPADVSGQGRYISIVTSVYTDPSYTTKSPSYGDEENTYLVQERVLVGRGGGGGWSGPDATTIRRIFREELEKLPKPPKPKDVDLGPVLASISSLSAKVSAIPVPEGVDMSPVLASLEAVKQNIVEKPVTPATDLSALETMVRDFTDRFDLVIDALSAELGATEKDIVEAVNASLKNEIPAIVEESMKDVTFTIAPATATVSGPKKEDDEEEEDDIDISKIAS